MKEELVHVLDLGESKVVCLSAKKAADGIRIVAISSVPCKGVKKGIISDVDETAGAISQAVKKVQQAVGEEIKALVVTISGPHLEGTNAQGFKPVIPRGRLITHQDVLEVVTHSRSIVFPPDREQIQALPREFKVDGVRDVRQPVGMPASKLEVVTYVASGQLSALQLVERAIALAGKTVDQMVIRPLASGIGVMTTQEMDGGAVVVDLGHGCTDIGVFMNGSIGYCASLPVGSGHVTTDLSHLLKCSPEEADRLKTSHGVAMAKLVPETKSVDVLQVGQSIARPLQQKVLCEIIEARMREIAVMVKQQVEKSGQMGLLPGGVILTGGGAQMEGVDKLFEEVLKHMRVRIAEPVVKLTEAPKAGLAAAVGAATFTIQCYEEITPANGGSSFKDRIRSLFSVFNG